MSRERCAGEPGSEGEVTRLLERVSAGDLEAENALFLLLQTELRSLAHYFMVRQAQGHTLQTSALINEAFLRLRAARGNEWTGRRHFMRVAAKAMRCVLVDHARGKQCIKRTAPGERVDVAVVPATGGASPAGILMVDDTIERLRDVNPSAAEVAVHRVIGGYSIADIAEILEVSERTVERYWRFGRAFLIATLER